MNLVVTGTGYVGLVTACVFAHIGHYVTCVDIDEKRIKNLKSGICPIYEENLDKLMILNSDRLNYTTNYVDAYKNADAIFIAVGTPEKEDGSANLSYVYSVVDQVIKHINKDIILVIKSTVPVATNDKIEKYINDKKIDFSIDVVSNPEFLAQGTAVNDSLFASRIVIGAETPKAFSIMRNIYAPLTKKPYNVPYLEMNRKSAELVKYASNDFLALKISYVNELANFCDKIGANIEEVTNGMSYDKRIGNKFLKSGIGYGGSCFPKDTKALYYTANTLGIDLKTVKACIDVNEKQKTILSDKIMEDFKTIKNLNIAILGATFKPGTDDLREAPSIANINRLLEAKANITVYDPVALSKLKKIFGNKIQYSKSIDDCIKNKDIVLIATEWPEIKNYDLKKMESLMKTPVIYDGRNCYTLNDIKNTKIKYYSIGRS